MNTVEEIRARLAPLLPATLEITDESHYHVGHAGSRNGGHFRVEISADAFAGKSRVARQRMVQAALKDLFDGKIHALSVAAYTPEETARRV